MNIRLCAGRPDDAEIRAQFATKHLRRLLNTTTSHVIFPTPKSPWILFSIVFARRRLLGRSRSYGRVVGSNFFWKKAVIAGVGSITVYSGVQKLAVGRRLMEERVMRRAREVVSRGSGWFRLLISHNRSLSLTLNLGLTRANLLILHGPAINWEIPGYAVRPAIEADFDDCNQVCLRVHGHDRGPEVLDAVNQGSATVVERYVASPVTGSNWLFWPRRRRNQWSF